MEMMMNNMMNKMKISCYLKIKSKQKIYKIRILIIKKLLANQDRWENVYNSIEINTFRILKLQINFKIGNPCLKSPKKIQILLKKKRTK